MSSDEKLKEAEFFLELLDALDHRKRSLTCIADPAQEASFLFSAILNAFYSAVVIMRDEEDVDVKDFVNENPEIYDRAKNGGQRAKTVHVSHTMPAVSGYIPPQGNKVTLDLRRTPLLVEEARDPRTIDLPLGPNHYMYISLKDESVEVAEFCYKHFYKLREFHAVARNQT